MSLVVTGSTDLAPPTTNTVDANGIAYLVIERRRKLVNDVVEPAFLQDIGGMGVWPGHSCFGSDPKQGYTA